ncbi:expressed unknown protein [Seminavis robusta]|uniref:F-box domain-containing protein n=1 Tax=Seminavis robusta TaxID=568900 RepID=A0A9N8DGC1_9STRA|nr:expressed unknown protein [Seminavis robusta]|eukprot:Sro105_g053320.1 n/a (126) ;mRNA; f:91672-92049
MVVTRGRKAEAASLMQVLQDSGCVTNVFEYLELEELGRFSLCNRTLHELCQSNDRIQLVQQFCKSYSRSWTYQNGKNRILRYADDSVSFAAARRGLDPAFAQLFAKTEGRMLSSIASWCGGWEAS